MSAVKLESNSQDTERPRTGPLLELSHLGLMPNYFVVQFGIETLMADLWSESSPVKAPPSHVFYFLTLLGDQPGPRGSQKVDRVPKSEGKRHGRRLIWYTIFINERRDLPWKSFTVKDFVLDLFFHLKIV